MPRKLLIVKGGRCISILLIQAEMRENICEIKNNDPDRCCKTLEPYKCNSCEFTTNFRVDLQKHVCKCSSLQNVQPKYEEIIEPTVADISQTADIIEVHGKLYQCDHCSYQTNWRTNFLNHQIRLHLSKDQGQWFMCKLCDFKTRYKNNLSVHETHKHVAEELINWEQCDQCDYKAKSKRSLYDHKRKAHLHKVNMLFKCDQCEYQTPWPGNLRKHKISMHLEASKVKWYSCVSCDYRGKWRTGLRKHITNKHVKKNGTNPLSSSIGLQEEEARNGVIVIKPILIHLDNKTNQIKPPSS